ncbi:MAG: mechanosensitive ion channel [Hyphomicrobiaceae bacterium]
MLTTVSTEALVKLFFMTGNLELSVILLFTGTIVAALLVHAAAVALLRRVLDPGGAGRPILRRAKGITRLVAVLIGIVVVLPAAEFDATVTLLAQRVLRIGLAVLSGWTALVAINTTAELTVARHRIDVENNLEARRIRTQVAVLRRIAIVVVVLVTTGAVLISFPAVQAYGVSLFASAGFASIIVGLAARPILTNLFAGIQIALTQPIRIDDVVIVEGEWGWIEEITTTYVVVRIWDLRRLVVPLAHFIEKPFENWTRESAAIIGTIVWHVDYTMPLEIMREKFMELVRAHPHWDGKVANLQVVEASDATLKVRGLVGARNSPQAWDMRCEIRERMIAWLQAEHPGALPLMRARITGDPDAAMARGDAAAR